MSEEENNPETPHSFLVIDDNGYDYYKELLFPFFNDAAVISGVNIDDALKFLNAELPDTVILNAYSAENQDSHYDNRGMVYAKKIADRYRENREISPLPKNILICHADKNEAERIAENLNARLNIFLPENTVNVYTFDFPEIELAYLLSQNINPDTYPVTSWKEAKTNGFREFLNNNLKTELSVSPPDKIPAEYAENEKKKKIPKTFFVIDDSPYTNPAESFITPFFPEADIYYPMGGYDAVENYLKEGIFPDCIMADACAVNRTIDTSWGLENINTIVEWFQNNAPDKEPQHIIIKSNDAHHAKGVAEHIKKTLNYSGNVYASSVHEPYLSERIFEGIPVETYDEGLLTTGHREFLNNTLGLNLPMTIEDIYRYQVENDTIDTRSVSEYVRNGIISLEKGIRLLSRTIDNIAGREFRATVKIPAFKQNENQFSFMEQSGNPVTGYAAFSTDDILKLASENKKSILFTEDYDSSVFSHSGNIAGIVYTSTKTPKHIVDIMNGWNISTVIASQNIHERFNISHMNLRAPEFLLDINGNPLNIVSETTECNGEKSFISYEPELYKIGSKHINGNNYHYGNDQVLPPINIDISTLAFTEIKFADEVTLDSLPYLYKGHYEIKHSESMNYRVSEVLEDSIKLISAWHKENNVPLLKFKSNLDGMMFGNDYSSTEIGLVRTERMIMFDEEQRNAFRDVVLTRSPYALQNFTDKHYNSITSLIAHTKYSDEIRIRLADASPDEFFTDEERKQIGKMYGDENIRGVQLGLAVPELYEEQLRAIFSAAKETEEKESKHCDLSDRRLPKIEILVPNVRTAEELIAVKEMTMRIADEIGYDKTHLGFGSMIETMDAVKNLKEIVPHCDFINIGTNDLTSDVLNCKRGDWNRIQEIIKSQKIDYNPFVVLHRSVVMVINQVSETAKKIKPDIDICVCGNHAENIESLGGLLRETQVTSVSMVSTEKNMLGLKAQFYNYSFKENYKPKSPEPA